MDLLAGLSVAHPQRRPPPQQQQQAAEAGGGGQEGREDDFVSASLLILGPPGVVSWQLRHCGGGASNMAGCGHCCVSLEAGASAAALLPSSCASAGPLPLPACRARPHCCATLLASWQTTSGEGPPGLAAVGSCCCHGCGCCRCAGCKDTGTA